MTEKEALATIDKNFRFVDRINNTFLQDDEVTIREDLLAIIFDHYIIKAEDTGGGDFWFVLLKAGRPFNILSGQANTFERIASGEDLLSLVKTKIIHEVSLLLQAFIDHESK